MMMRIIPPTSNVSFRGPCATFPLNFVKMADVKKQPPWVTRSCLYGSGDATVGTWTGLACLFTDEDVDQRRQARRRLS